MQVVATILADAGQVDDGGDAERCQSFTVADAGELQQMRALHRPGRDDHLLAGAREAASAVPSRIPRPRRARSRR